MVVGHFGNSKVIIYEKENKIMSMEEKLAMLEEVMELEEGELKADMLLSDIEEYNSMAKLSLIVMMSDEFSKKLTNEQIKKFTIVQDILDFMA